MSDAPEVKIAKEEKLRELQLTVVSLLHHYLGSDELPPNQGFRNKEFERAMVDVGWRAGMEWCALFSEMIWKKAYESVYGKYPEEFDKLFSANSQQTYKNFVKAGWAVDAEEPAVGCLVIWKKAAAHSTSGHIDVCEVAGQFDPATRLPVRIQVIGGNVSDGVRRKSKSSNKYGTYKLMGFVHLEAL